VTDPLDAFHYCQVEFAADGTAVHPEQEAGALALADDVTDLLVISHGWNNNTAEALSLYKELAGNMTAVRDAGHEPQLAARTLGLVGVIWPSKKFAGADAAPPPGAASVEHSDPTLARDLLGLADAFPAAGAATLAAAAKLVPELDHSTSARTSYADLLRSLIPHDTTSETGDSLEAFRKLDGTTLLDSLDVAALAETLAALRSMDQPGDDSGGIQAVPTGAPGDDNGGAAGFFGDAATQFASKARALMNLTTYYTMKARAGLIGQASVAPMLEKMPSTTRLHLIGHSFGARLVTSAANTLPDADRLRSISLLQGAFSHYSFSGAWSPGKAGFYRAVVSPGRVSGPMVVTHTRNDNAVGIAYAMASSLANQVASDVGGPDSLYGGLGSNGAQKTDLARNDQDLGAVGTEYDFGDRAVYNLRADTFISSHSDVRGPEVAHAVLRAVAATD
jgi:hypothetical protein